jgi:MarR family transcriptional regulator, transcriptional regulator for hemolysin
MGAVAKPSAPEADSAEALSANLGWLLSQASYALSTQLTAALESLGISPRAYCVLATAMTGEFTQIELAKAVGLDKTTMVITVDELEAAGLAKRVPSKSDRRARVIEVTRAGERKVVRAEQIVEQTQAEVLDELSERERKAFISALGRLVSGRLSKAVECTQPPRRRAPRA